MTKELIDMQELIAELKQEKRLTRDQAMVLYGRIATLYEIGYLTDEEWKTIRAEIPLTKEDVRDIRV